MSTILTRLFHLTVGFPAFFLLLTGCQPAEAQPEVSPPPAISKDSLARKYTQRAEQYLIKNDTLWSQIRIDTNGISLLPHPDSLPEITIFYNELDWLPRLTRQFDLETALQLYEGKGTAPLAPEDYKIFEGQDTPSNASGQGPLAGWKIALDPGHLGGDMDFAFLEKKFVRIRANDRPQIRQPIAFNEGNLNLGTALLLRDTLEALGAEVLVTRTQEAHTGLGGTFQDWLVEQMETAVEKSGEDFRDYVGKGAFGFQTGYLKAAAWNWVDENEWTGEDSLWWMTKADMRTIYRIPFLRADFKARAAQINAFHPDLTLILHYNIYEKNEWDRDYYLRAVDDNYSMAFIPGSFMAGELGNPEDRMLFLARLLSEDLAASEQLSAAVVDGYEQVLGVPAIEWDDSLKYLRNASLRTGSKGVFARNLSLTRLVQGPLCYGEALYQDNVNEAVALNKQEYVLEGMETPLPDRIRDAVHAYLAGILAYAEGAR